jgi:2-polyprenyl-3-methyl-5-hydroxy-6-metoxy-1,4-benzoquinol methylase
MTSVKDPDGADAAALDSLADLSGLRVLEIGAGEGRLTQHLARKARYVVAIDSDEEAIAVARTGLPADVAERVLFKAVDATELDEPEESCDAAFLSWSL